MRYDYALYSVSIVCFVLASIFLVGYLGYASLIGNPVTDLLVSMLSAILGVIFLGIGYWVRPRMVLTAEPPLPEPSPTPTPTPAPEPRPRPRLPGAPKATCPECGTEVASPRKTWKMAGRPDKSGMRTELTVGLFDCPNCHKVFRAVLGKRKI